MPIRNDGFYLEFLNLFVEWDLPERYGDSISITNVQMMHPSDPGNDKLWIDVTDHITPDQREALVLQIDDMYQDASHD